MHPFRHVIPSMFHRRLTMLALLGGFVMVALGMQITRLTLVEGEMWRSRAEAVLEQTRLIPTVRGRILDRQGRVLAQDKPSFDVAVSYPVLNGQWAYKQARRAAARANSEVWRKLTVEQREALIARYRQPYDAQVETMWQVLADLGHVSRQDLADRAESTRDKVERIAQSVARRRLAARREEFGPDIPVSTAQRPVAEQLASHAMLLDIDDSARLTIERFIALAYNANSGNTASSVGTNASDVSTVWREVGIERSRDRQYPLTEMTLVLDRANFPGPLQDAQPIDVRVSGLATHLLGEMRTIWEEDVNGRRDEAGNVITPGRPMRRTDDHGQTITDLGGYLPGDQIGRWGIEQTMENTLRGLRGRIITHLDTQQEERLEPLPGRDVRLSIDVQLQARIQALMAPEFGLTRLQPWHRRFDENEPATNSKLGDQLNSAAIVMEVATGQVLAAVSNPTFTYEQLRDHPEEVWGDQLNRTWLNRVVAMPYEPGSTVKPLVLSAAVTEGRIAPGQTITCNGYLDPGHPGRYRCWIFKSYHRTHGPLAGPEAIARSCNVFFYTLGRRLGAALLVQWYGRFGLGAVTNCGLLEEMPGDLPDLSLANQRNSGFEDADAVQMGIGQGPMRWTVIQAASAYAAIARGGYYLQPTFVAEAGGEPVRQEGRDMGLDPRGVDMALRGLYEAANEDYGTAHHLSGLSREKTFNVEGVVVRAKSGTADAAPQRVDSDGDGRITGNDRIVRTGDHSWVIAMVGKEGDDRPRYIVAVVVEYAGSGGAVAGPIANQIIHALRIEGYL